MHGHISEASANDLVSALRFWLTALPRIDAGGTRVLAITFHDLEFRARQFLIAVLGAGLVFAMTLLLAGMAASFHAEIGRTVRAVGVSDVDLIGVT